MSSTVQADRTVQRRITKSEVARQLGIDMRAVNRLIAEGHLKMVEMPSRIRNSILQSDVDAIIAGMNQAS